MTTTEDEDVYPELPGGVVVDLAEARAARLTAQQRRVVAGLAKAARSWAEHPSGEAMPPMAPEDEVYFSEYEPGRFLVWCTRGDCDLVAAGGGAGVMCLTCSEPEPEAAL